MLFAIILKINKHLKHSQLIFNVANIDRYIITGVLNSKTERG